MDPAQPVVESNEGKLQLAWGMIDAGALPDGWRYRLSQGQGEEPTIWEKRYEGRDQGSFISGLREGVYQFKIEVLDSSGNPIPEMAGSEVTLVVKYPPRWLVFLLLSVGAIVFICLVTAIIGGARRGVSLTGGNSHE